MYRLRKNTMGSVKLSVNGLTSTIVTISLRVILAAASSGPEMSSLFPVIFRRRRDRRYKIFAALVSGKKRNRNTKQKALSHINSHIGHVQGAVNPPVIGPYSTAKPPISGPKVGPQTAAMPQIDMAYALLAGLQISAREAPPVAKTGEPKKPLKNRKARNMPKLVASAVGTWNATKMTRVPI